MTIHSDCSHNVARHVHVDSTWCGWEQGNAIVICGTNWDVRGSGPNSCVVHPVWELAHFLGLREDFRLGGSCNWSPSFPWNVLCSGIKRHSTAEKRNYVLTSVWITFWQRSVTFLTITDQSNGESSSSNPELKLHLYLYLTSSQWLDLLFSPWTWDLLAVQISSTTLNSMLVYPWLDTESVSCLFSITLQRRHWCVFDVTTYRDGLKSQILESIQGQVWGFLFRFWFLPGSGVESRSRSSIWAGIHFLFIIWTGVRVSTEFTLLLVLKWVADEHFDTYRHWIFQSKMEYWLYFCSDFIWNNALGRVKFDVELAIP